jgi:N-acetylmuramic acid 6-phosphate etherase
MPDINIEDMAPHEILALMDRAEMRAMKAVERARKKIAEAASAAARAIGAGGRLVYVGAGTSGRLGVLDASECPPTFSSKPWQVVGVIAGGNKALKEAVEGAEDGTRAGRAAMARLKVGEQDMVVGVSASGTTPYVLAALDEAHKRGAGTWLLSCGKNQPTPGPLAAGAGVMKVINLDTGPEVIQGSTRLAAGTATKLALNRITTAAFIKLGKVYGDLMVDVMPTNAKLVKRACGIIMEVTGCGEAEAAMLLKKSGNSPKVAIVMKQKGVSRRAAERLLREKGGFLRMALAEKEGPS